MLASYRGVFLLYCAIFIAVFWRVLFDHHVIAPHAMYDELGLATPASLETIENRKFSDFSNAFLPEIAQHMQGERSAWLATFTNANELGRPLHQIAGFSPSYFPTWIAFHFTDVPWTFFNLYTLSICFFSGLFFLLLCRELALHPMAGLIAAASLAFSPLFLYWISFPMFAAVYCWGCGILWSLTRLAKKADYLAWVALSFSTYSLLMTGYPQPIVFHLYLFSVYFLFLFLWHKHPHHARLHFLLTCSSAVFVAAILVLPVYADVYLNSTLSPRAQIDTAFFTSVLPGFTTFNELFEFFFLSTVAPVFGTGTHSDFPLKYNGLSLTLFVCVFAILSFFLCLRKTLPLWIVCIILACFTLVHDLYAFGVEHLGFHLSRSTTLTPMTLPMCLILAFTADTLLKKRTQTSKSKIFTTSVILVLILFGALIFADSNGITVSWDHVTALLTVNLLLTFAYRRHAPIFIFIALCITIFFTTKPLILSQDRDRLANSSPLLSLITENLEQHQRLALLVDRRDILPANLNALFGISSVHSYNSLSSSRYHQAIENLGGKVIAFGRRNMFIQPDLNSHDFWLSNIGLVISDHAHTNAELELIGQHDTLYVYRVKQTMGQAVITSIEESMLQDLELTVTDGMREHSQVISPERDQADLLQFDVAHTLSETGRSSLLIVSLKHYPQWQAEAQINDQWRDIDTLRVNDAYLGIVIPEQANKLRLTFKTYSKLAYLGHLFWSLILVSLIITTLYNYRKNPLATSIP